MQKHSLELKSVLANVCYTYIHLYVYYICMCISLTIFHQSTPISSSHVCFKYSHCFALPGILPRHPFSSSPGLLRSHDSKVLRVLSEKATCRWYPSVHTNLSFCISHVSTVNQCSIWKIENRFRKDNLRKSSRCANSNWFGKTSPTWPVLGAISRGKFRRTPPSPESHNPIKPLWELDLQGEVLPRSLPGGGFWLLLI